MKRRSRGEARVLTNKYNHVTNGNRNPEYLDAVFANVPGMKLSHQDKKIAIQTVLQKYKPGILGVAEPNYEDMRTMYFPGYKLVKGKMSGGKKIRLNVLVRETLVDYTVESFTSEVPSVLIKVNGFKYMMFYREWRKDGKEGTDKMEMQEARWDAFMHRVRRIGGKLTVMGDANLCWLTEDTDHQKRLANMKETLYSTLSELGYLQLIKENTRHEKDKKGLLDHIYTKQIKYIDRIYNENVHGHDHNCIGVRMRQDKPIFQSRVVTMRNYDKVEKDDFDKHWHMSNPHEIFDSEDIERQIDIFEFKVRHVLDIVAPVKKFQTKENYAPWVNSDLKKEMRKRDVMRKEAINGGSWAAFKDKKREVRRSLAKAEKEYLNNYLNFSNEKVGWKRLKNVSQLTQQKDNTITLNIDGKMESDPKTVASHMSKFFVTKVEDIVEEFPPDPVESTKYFMEYIYKKKPGTFEFRTVGYKYIKEVIMSLKNVDSVGLDEIPVKVYKKFRSALIPSITKIVNNCIRQGIYPDRYKQGIISPIPKKGDLGLVSNWRPVVLLPVASRILEGVLSRQLMNYLENKQLISPSQHSYRQHKGCSSCLQDLDTVVSKARDEGRAVGMLQTDMTSAFNCVNAASLIPKLRMAGVGNFSCGVIRSYLHNRQNRVRVGNVMSAPEVIKTGSGEGSQISPLLWLVFILDCEVVLDRVRSTLEPPQNPAPPNLGAVSRQILTSSPKDKQTADRCKQKQKPELTDMNYADDINSVVVAETNERVVEIMFKIQDEFAIYFKSLGLKESRGKQAHIMFSRYKEAGNRYVMNGREAEKQTRLLGVVISENWEFDQHCTNTIGKMVARIPHLRAIRDYVSREVLLRVSKSLFCSIYEFQCDIAFRKLSLQRKLQRILNILLRVLTWSPRMRSVREMLAETEWVNITITVKYFSIWSLQRVMTWKAASIPYNLVDWERDRVRYETRTRHIPIIWKPKTAAAYNSWLFQSVKHYDALGLYCTGWEDSETAKKDLREKLLQTNQNSNL